MKEFSHIMNFYQCSVVLVVCSLVLLHHKQSLLVAGTPAKITPTDMRLLYMKIIISIKYNTYPSISALTIA